MDRSDARQSHPRQAPEGEIPLISIEGSAYDCGCEWAEYGMWSTGMTLTRHDMSAKGGGPRQGLNMRMMGHLGLACRTIDEVVELYRKHAGPGKGGYMFSDASGRAAAIDITANAVGVRYMQDGILTRSNHPESAECAPDEESATPGGCEDSHYRTRGLYRLFHAERGRLTAQKAYQLMADHTMYPAGQCKHSGPGEESVFTSCLYIAEPSRGLFHAVRGQPCCNWPVTYRMKGTVNSRQ